MSDDLPSRSAGERPSAGSDAPPEPPRRPERLEVVTRVDDVLTAEEWLSTYATALAYRRLGGGQGLSLVRANESISLGLTHCTRTFAATMELPRAKDPRRPIPSRDDDNRALWTAALTVVKAMRDRAVVTAPSEPGTTEKRPATDPRPSTEPVGQPAVRPAVRPAVSRAR